MRLLGALLVTVALSATACGDASTGSCVEIREPEDPLSIQHVLDPDGVVFRTDPPTSGPHLAGPPLEGLLDEPITPASQVRALESGGVVVQYLETDSVDELRALLDDDAVRIAIAPASTLPAAVVATAWTWKLTCERPDVDRIREFARERTADAPGAD